MPSLLVVSSSRSESVPTGSSIGFTVGLPGVSQLDAAADVPPTFGDGDTLLLDVDDFFGVDRDLRLGSSPGLRCSRFHPSGSVLAEVSECSDSRVLVSTARLVDVLLTTGSRLFTGVRSLERGCC